MAPHEMATLGQPCKMNDATLNLRLKRSVFTRAIEAGEFGEVVPARCTFLTLLMVISRTTNFVLRYSTISTKDERRCIPSAHFLSGMLMVKRLAWQLAWFTRILYVSRRNKLIVMMMPLEANHFSHCSWRVR